MEWMFSPDESSVLCEIMITLSLANREDLVARFAKGIANVNEERNDLNRMMTERGHGRYKLT